MSHYTDDFKDMMEYEFEIETETRYIIEPGNIADYNWVNHVVDVYDQSGRARIRVKNGVPRLSIKVPLFSKDTETSKTCIRIEYKPITKEQEEELLQIRKLILAEKGAQMTEKFGAPLENKDGTKTWINRDTKGNWWVEADEGITLNLPETIKILGTQKSGIKA